MLRQMHRHGLDARKRESIAALIRISSRSHVMSFLNQSPNESLRDCRQAAMICFLNRMLPLEECIPFTPWKEVNTGSIPSLNDNPSFIQRMDSIMREELKSAREKWRADEHRMVVRIYLPDLAITPCSEEEIIAFGASCGLKPCQRETIFRLFIDNCFGKEEGSMVFPQTSTEGENKMIWPHHLTLLRGTATEHHLKAFTNRNIRRQIRSRRAWAEFQFFLFEI